jgi:hypothetical protein
MPLKTRVIVTKGPPQGGAVLDALIYRAQVFDSEHPNPHRPPTWECKHEHQSALDAYACAMEWVQQNEAPSPDPGSTP